MLQPALRRRLPTTAATTGALSRSAHRQAPSSTSLVLAGPRASGGIRARPWEALQLQLERGGARRGLAVETSEPTPVPPPPPAPRNYVYPAVLALTATAVVFVMMTYVLVSIVDLIAGSLDARLWITRVLALGGAVG